MRAPDPGLDVALVPMLAVLVAVVGAALWLVLEARRDRRAAAAAARSVRVRSAHVTIPSGDRAAA